MILPMCKFKDTQGKNKAYSQSKTSLDHSEYIIWCNVALLCSSINLAYEITHFTAVNQSEFNTYHIHTFALCSTLEISSATRLALLQKRKHKKVASNFLKQWRTIMYPIMLFSFLHV